MRHNQLLKINLQVYFIVLMLGLSFIWTRLPSALAQTPTPGPTPSIILSTPEPFGINGISHWGSDNQERRRQTVLFSPAPGAIGTPAPKNYVAFAKEDIGADWDRWSVHWNMVEDYQGNFNFVNDSNKVAIEDGLKLASDKNHVKVVLVLNGGIAGQYNNVVCGGGVDADGKCLRYHYQECDDTDDPNTCYAIKGLSYEGKDQAGNWLNPWARFINEVTSNPAIRDKVAAWEIINEDDLIFYDVPSIPTSASNPGGAPDSLNDPDPYARNFIQAIKVACEVLAQTNPSGDILLGGIEHVEAYKLAKNTDDSKYRPVMDALRTDPDLACIDGISLHSYGNPKDSAFLIENRNVIWDPDPDGEPWPVDKQIWITESGLEHATDISFPFNGAGCGTKYVCGTEAHQASYIIEHAVLTRKAFWESGISGKMFHYNYIDDYADSGNPPDGAEDMIWGLFDGGLGALPAARAATFIFPLLKGATMGPPTGETCASITQPGYNASNNEWIIFQTKNGDIVHILWNTDPNRNPVSLTFRPCADSSPVKQYDQEGVLIKDWSPGAVISLDLVGTDHGLREGEANRNYPVPFPDEYMLKGEPVILVEKQMQGSIEATTEMAYNNCQPVGIDIKVSAPTQLESFSISCSLPNVRPFTLVSPGTSAHILSTETTEYSPFAMFSLFKTEATYPSNVSFPCATQTFHLYNTLPNPNVYVDTFPLVPPINWTYTFDFRDFAGNSAITTVTNPGPQQCSAAGTGPGGDHPDDNQSDASSLPTLSRPHLLTDSPPPAAPSGQMISPPNGARTEARVAILQRGYSHDLWRVVHQLGELADFVRIDFDPGTVAAKYPVLLIPSGGLYGLENSAIFKKRLESYAEAGGTIVAFAQQHGYEFSVLPGASSPLASSPPLSGYGWQEDNSCYEASLLLAADHPILSGFSQASLTAHVDGYFSTVPTNTTVLLTRRQNGAPGVILYPYGQGHIIATNIYEDWGAANGQLSADTETFLRNLLSWAIAPTDPPNYGPGAAVTVPLSITNTTQGPVAKVRLDLISPNREIVETQMVSVTIAPGASTNLSFNTTAAAPLGLWRVDATLLNPIDWTLSFRMPVGYFTVNDPPQTIAPDAPFALNITAQSDRFPKGSRGEFTFHLTNRTGEARTVTVRYGLPHHTWEVGTDPNTGSGYGLFYGLSQEVTIPAQSEATFVYSPTLYTTDRLWARLDEGNQTLAYAHFAVFPLPPDMIRVSDLGTDAGGYARGNLVEVRATLTNNYGYRFEAPIARLTVTDAEETELYQADVPLGPLVSGAATQFQTTFTLSPTAHSGVAKVNLEIGPRYHGQFYRYGSARATFRVSSSPLGSTFPANLALTPGLSQTVPLNLTNLNPFLDVTSGQVRLQLLEGSTPLASSISQTFSLAANQSLTLPLSLAVPALQFNGDYRLAVTLEDEYDTQAWQTAPLPLTFSAQTTLNQPAHRVRETAAVTLTLRNPGPFVQVLTLTLAAPSLAFEQTGSVTLNSGQSLSQNYAVPIPGYATAGQYPLEITALLASAPLTASPVITEVGAIYLPDSQLQATVSGQPTAPAGTLTVDVANLGGVDTLASYHLSIYDNRGLAVTTVTGADAEVLVDQPLSIPMTIPDQFRSGPYNLAGVVTDQSTGQRVSVYQALNLAGLTDQLATFTDAETYLTTDPIETTAVITNTGIALTDGQLSMRIVSAGPVETAQWVTYTTADGLAEDTVTDLAVDGQGNKWFIHPQELSRLSPGGNWEIFLYTEAVFYQAIAATSEIVWVGTNDGAFAFDGTTQTPLENGCVQGQSINDIAVDAAGRIWFATGNNRLCVLDPGGTPANFSDDEWGQFTASPNDLPGDNPLRLAFDATGYVWVMHSDNLNVLNYGTDPLDQTVNDFVQLFSLSGERSMTALTIDAAGITWLGTTEGLYRLNDGGTILDPTDDSWTSYTAYDDQVIDNYIQALAPDQAGNLWIGTGSGLSILLPGEGWRHYTPFDGLGSGVINAIVIDAAGNRWLATNPDTNSYENESVNLPGGVTAAIGPGLPEAPWKTFTYNDNSSNNDLLGNEIAALATDEAGNLWIVGNPDDVPQQSLPWKAEGLASPLRQGYNPFVQRLGPGNNWTDFEPPFYSYSNIPDMVVDTAGHLWIAVDDGSDGDELYVLSPQQATWETRRPAELVGSPKALAVAGTTVWVAFDAVLTGELANPEGIAAYSLVDQTWTVVYRGSESLDPADHLEFRDLVIDSAGDLWAATDKGVRRLSSDGSTWLTYDTTQPDTLVSDDVQAVAIDSQGHRWFATPDGTSVLAADDSQWATFSINASTLTLDHQGDIWFGHNNFTGGQRLNYGVSPFDQAEDILTVYDDFRNLGNKQVNDISVDEAGQIWFATSARGLARYAPPFSSAGRVLWQHTAVLNAGAPETVQEVVNLTALELGVTGKLYLEADLATTLEQPLGSARYPFYIFPTQTGLTLAPNRTIYQPGQSITLTGQIRNGAAQSLTGQTLAVSVNGQVVYSETNITVPAEDDYPFSINTTAPANPGPVIVEAAIDDLTVQDSFEVATPALDTHLSAPALVGLAPFDLRLTLTNLGRLNLDLAATLDGQAEALALPAGETRIISSTKQIAADTLITAQISGDITASVTRTVQMGEAGDVTIAPQPLYPVGSVEIPYLVTNTGQLPLAFPLALNLYAGATFVQSDTLDIALPVAGTASGLLAFDLPAGDYRLDYSAPYATGAANWQVAALDQVGLEVQAQTPVGASIPLTITLTNTGANAVTGRLAVDANFFSDKIDFDLEPGQAFTPTITVSTTNAAPGPYPVTITAVAANGMALATQTVTVTVPSPHLTVTAVPSQTNLTPGQVVTLTFTAENDGGAAGEALLTFTLADFEDESQLVSLAPGESSLIDFSFYLPPELAAGDYLATYVFSDTTTHQGERGDFTLNVAGMDLGVTAALDKAVYAPGETATLTLNVTNQWAQPTTNLYALARYGNTVVTQTFNLAGNGAQTLNLAVPVAAEGVEDTVFYGIYDQASTRGIYLNTTHLYRFNSLITLYPDKQAYQPGETVQVTVVTTLTGQLLVQAPSYSQTHTLNGSNTGFSFTLPNDLVRGTQSIEYYLLPNGPAYQTVFDVDAPWVRVTEAHLVDAPYVPGDQIQADLTVASETSIQIAIRSWINYPDNTQGAEVVDILTLQPDLNNHVFLETPLVTSQAGSHRLLYQLTDPNDPERIYAAGVEEFDVGTVILLGVHTDQESYTDPTNSVTAEVTVYAPEATGASLILELDDGNEWNYGLNLAAGIQSLTFNLPGSIQPGSRNLQAKVILAGLTSTTETYFEYGTEAADLQMSLPVLESSIVSEDVTLKANVHNFGDFPAAASTVAFWDGDPATSGSLIGTASIPALDVNQGTTVTMDWNLRQKAGLHYLYAVADSNNTVAEYYEDNNTHLGSVNVPSFVVTISTDNSVYNRDETILITAIVTSLRPEATLNLSATTFINYFGTYDDVYVHEYEQPIVVPPDSQVEITTPWIAANARGGDYSARLHITGKYEYLEIGGDQAFLQINHSANFTSTSLLTGTAPLTVTFIDRSTPLNQIESWQWDFGDGGSSIEVNPTHVYTREGSYTVTLTAATSQTTYTEIKPNYITVMPSLIPIPAFSADPVTDLIPMTVTFTDTSTGTVITRTWDFGDSTPTVVTTSVAVSHTYSLAGVYTPTLTIEGSEGSAVVTRPAYILAVAPQISGTFALEAEDYARQISEPDLTWQTRTVHPGYSGSGYVQARPDVDALFTTTPISASSELQYGLGLTITGTYTVWLRGYAENSAGDSVFIGLDGQPFIATDYISAYPPQEWAWSQTLVENSQPVTFTVDMPGAHILHLWGREDGFNLDQIILTTDDNFTPGD